MKTSGFRCETKFGLLGFLGHTLIDNGEANGNMDSRKGGRPSTIKVFQIFADVMVATFIFHFQKGFIWQIGKAPVVAQLVLMPMKSRETFRARQF